MTENPRRLPRIMAFDHGARRIGVAISEAGFPAVPLATVQAVPHRRAMEAISTLIDEHRPEELLVGLPLHMHGAEGVEAERCRRFAAELEAAHALPVHLHDERLTTAMAVKGLIAADVRRSRRREVVDRLAAVYLLQGYVDSLKGGAS